MTGRILGVDPGISGALALYNRQRTLFDMPITGDVKHHEINGPELCRWLREHAPDHAFIEFASARPGQGVTSMFRFGCSYSALKMALTACGVTYTIVTPVRWKKAVGVPTSANKEAPRQPRCSSFPDQAKNLAPKMDHARADAMLVAHYGIPGTKEFLPQAGTAPDIPAISDK